MSFSEFGVKSEIDEDGDNWIEMAITPKVAGYEDGNHEPSAEEVPIFEISFLCLFISLCWIKILK